MSSLAYLRPVVHDADLSFLISCAATALTFYEHLITIRLEVQQIWRREASVATALFVATRYLNVLNRLFAILGLYPIRDVIVSVATTVLWLQAATSSILVAVMSAIAAIRIFALWGRDYRFLIIVLLTGFFPAFASLFFRNASSVYIIPTRIYSCQAFPTAMTAATFKSLSIATRVIAIVSDGIVAVLTWVKTYQIYTLSKGARFSANYSALLLRDVDEPKYRAVCILNSIAIVYIVMTGTNLLNDLIVTLSSILMARFLLNLRDERARVETLSFAPGGTTKLTVLSGLSSVRFASDAFDSMGGSISVHAGVDSVHAEDDDGGEEDPDEDRSIESEESTCVGSHENLHYHKKGAIEWA
ncbi:hypothetical protein BD413DRAFT_486231 [Trametes elegans]|nr:hypothetical protein BD413DRAFT_486231 [Trametes elegans]